MNIASSGNPVVSVVTATRNRPSWLRVALHSIASQTFDRFESIVIDDGSSAETIGAYREIWPELGGRFVLQEPPVAGARGSGPAAARNRGIHLAKGEFIAFCDDDDRWKMNDHLGVAVDVLTREGGDFYFANMCGENQGNVTIPDWFPGSPRLTTGPRVNDDPVVYEVSLRDLAATMHHHYPHPNGCVIRADLVREVGGFWERVDIGEDIDFVLRAAERARRIFYRPDRVVGYNVTPRDSAFSRQTKIEHYLECIAVAQHILALCTHARVRRCARSLQGYFLRQLARELEESRSDAVAPLPLAWQALCVYPTPGALAYFARLAVLRSGAWLRPRVSPGNGAADRPSAGPDSRS
jgi:glycosyltransferase involved in cell wall biosynthesis